MKEKFKELCYELLEKYYNSQKDEIYHFESGQKLVEEMKKLEQEKEEYQERIKKLFR